MPSPKRTMEKDNPHTFPAKAARNRNPLKRENGLANEINMLMMGNPSPIPTSLPPPPSFADAEKENRLGLSLLLSPKSFKPIVKREDARQSSERTKLRQMQEKLKQMTIEKEKAEALLKEQQKATLSLSKQLEEMQEKFKQESFDAEKTQEILKEKDKMLNWKDEQLENLGKEQEKLQLELNRLRKLKEFKPTLSSSFIQEEVENKACLQKKKPSSAYMLWRKDQWNQAKRENPEAQLKDICNILGMKWKNLSAKEKKPYEEKHLAEKEFCLQIIRKESEKRRVLIKEEQRQKAAMELLEQYLLFRKEIDKESKRTRTERDPSKPKQPLSAFFLFLNERRPALLAEKKNAFEIAKIAGQEWRNMNEEKQVPYKEIANKLKYQYLQQMELYKRKKDEGSTKARNISTTTEQQKQSEVEKGTKKVQ